MLITDDGYGLVYYKNRNLIEIYLPQTPYTATNTITDPVDRKIDLSDSELNLLLQLARKICRKDGVR